MSFWGATVITSMITAIPVIGVDIVQWIWGGFSVDNATLNRFLSLHYLLPFIIAALIIFHLLALHEHGSNNPLGINSASDKIPFHPYYITKDGVGVVLFLILISLFVFFEPNLLGHSDNYIEANSLVTPTHIVPEWYFLPFYAILRAIPDKLAGVVAMVLAILVLMILPYLHTCQIRSSPFRPIAKKTFWFFVGNFILLVWLGGSPAEEPYVLISRISTCLYFSYYLIIVPIVGYLENKLLLNTVSHGVFKV